MERDKHYQFQQLENKVDKMADVVASQAAILQDIAGALKEFKNVTSTFAQTHEKVIRLESHCGQVEKEFRKDIGELKSEVKNMSDKMDCKAHEVRLVALEKRIKNAENTDQKQDERLMGMLWKVASTIGFAVVSALITYISMKK